MARSSHSDHTKSTVPMKGRPAQGPTTDDAEPPADLQPSPLPNVYSTQRPPTSLKWECLIQHSPGWFVGTNDGMIVNGSRVMLVTTVCSSLKGTDTVTWNCLCVRGGGEGKLLLLLTLLSSTGLKTRGQNPNLHCSLIRRGPPSGRHIHPLVCQDSTGETQVRYNSGQLPEYRFKG